MRQEVLKSLDAGRADRVGAEEFRGATISLSGHAFPELDGCFRIIAGTSHENGADFICFQFLLTGKGETEGDVSYFGGSLGKLAPKE